MSGRLKIFFECVFLVLPLAWLIGHTWPYLVSPMTASLRALLTYSLDASSILISVRDALHVPLFQLEFTGYGQLYYNLCILTSAAYGWILPLTERAILTICRLLSLFAGCLSVGLVYLFARQFLGVIEACFAACLLALIPAVAELALDIHPDTLQMFLLTLSLYLCACGITAARSPEAAEASEKPGRKDIWFVFGAAAAAGAAFSTKYVGVQLLPLIMLAAVMLPEIAFTAVRFTKTMRWVCLLCAMLAGILVVLTFVIDTNLITQNLPEWRSIPEFDLNKIALNMRIGFALVAIVCAAMAIGYGFSMDFWPYRKWLTKSWLALGTVVIFLLAFALGSPWSVLYHLRFFPSVYEMATYVNFGHGVKAPWFGFGWLGLLASNELAGPLPAALGAIGAVAIIAALLKRNLSPLNVAFGLVLAWVVIFGGFLIARVNLAKGYYMLPLIPAFVMLAAFGLWTIRKGLTQRLGASAAATSTIAIAGIVLANMVFHSTEVLAHFREIVLPVELSPENKALEAWFLRCVPPETKIFPAPYSYIPPGIGDLWLQTQGYSALTSFKPQLVVLRKSDIAAYLGNTDKLSSNVTGTTNDAVRYYEIVTRSEAWRHGPDFGPYEAYATPQFAATLSQRGPGCF